MRLFGKVPVAAAEGHVGRDALLCEVDDDRDDGACLFFFATAGKENLVGGIACGEGGTNGPSTHEIYERRRALALVIEVRGRR